MIGEITYDPNQRQFSLNPVKAYMAYRGVRRTVRDVGNEIGRFRENIQPKPRADQRPTFWGQFNGKNRALREQRQMEHEERLAKLQNQPAIAQAKAQAKQSNNASKYAYKTAKVQGKYAYKTTKVQGKYGWKTARDQGMNQGRNEGEAKAKYDTKARIHESDNKLAKSALD